LLIVNNSSISNGKSDFSDANKSAMENPLLILATETPLLIVSNGFFVAAESATDKSVAQNSATTNLHRIFSVADSVAKLF